MAVLSEGLDLRPRARSAPTRAYARERDELDRDVYCVFGTLLDNVTIQEVVEWVEMAVSSREPLFISTPNINFLVSGLADPAFREAMAFSGLCLPDGMWLVWLARFMGAPIKTRITGGDLVDALAGSRSPDRPMGVYFFGGPPGAAENAKHEMNIQPNGLRCVGARNPGIVSVEDISRDDSISAINASGADFLVVALGAKKGQIWLRRNHARISAPVRAHLGAVVNHIAGSVKRAPNFVQKLGLEWVWRIKEEPELWRRYAGDGAVLALLLSSVLVPLTLSALRIRLARALSPGLKVTEEDAFGKRVISLEGSLTRDNAAIAIEAFRDAVREQREIVVDLSGARALDSRFLGLFAIAQKLAQQRGLSLSFVGVSNASKSTMKLHGFELPPARSAPHGFAELAEDRAG